MARANAGRKILIVDDESESAILRAVRRRLAAEGWDALVVQPEPRHSIGEEFEAAALWSIEEEPEVIFRTFARRARRIGFATPPATVRRTDYLAATGIGPARTR